MALDAERLAAEAGSLLFTHSSRSRFVTQTTWEVQLSMCLAPLPISAYLTLVLGRSNVTSQTETIMDQDYQLTMSPLCQSVTDNDRTVRFEIYHGPGTDWTLEAVDASNNSTVWDDLFDTDQAALDEGLRTIREEGIESLIGPPASGGAAA